MLDQDYSKHSVFSKLRQYAHFYGGLSHLVMLWLNQGTSGIWNMDTYLYGSMKGTLQSIHDVLLKGRINDAYALLRKFHDIAIINVYVNLYLEENHDIEKSLVVKEIENWRSGTKSLPEFRVMSQYIRNSPKLKIITDLLYKDDTFKDIRNRCNDHTHYNFYHNLFMNNEDVYVPDRLKTLGIFLQDIENLVILHLSYIFHLNNHYMMSVDYIDALEVGITPDEEIQYQVAPFIQEIFDTLIKPKRPNIFEAIKAHTRMQLS